MDGAVPIPFQKLLDWAHRLLSARGGANAPATRVGEEIRDLLVAGLGKPGAQQSSVAVPGRPVTRRARRARRGGAAGRARQTSRRLKAGSASKPGKPSAGRLRQIAAMKAYWRKKKGADKPKSKEKAAV